jgi:hypothetical protein
MDAILDGRLVISREIRIMIEGEFVERPDEPPAGNATA